MPHLHSDLIFNCKQPLQLEGGQTLEQYHLVYQTFGKLNSKKDNAILICHALGADHRFSSLGDDKPGWWQELIGPDKAIDTNQFFVVCANNLGGCAGSTGPNQINPKTGKLWAADFPIVTVKDWVESQRQLQQHLKLDKWLSVIGGSLGGMQALQWAISYPDKLECVILVAAASHLTAQNIAFNEVARQAIQFDKDFCDGYYYQDNKMPKDGLMLARMLGHITYLSRDSMDEKFGREKIERDFKFSLDEVDFQVQKYLHYQAQKFIDREKFDANTYLRMTKALDYFDPAREFGGDLTQALKPIKARLLLVSFTSDWRFSPKRSEQMVKALLHAEKSVSYIQIESKKGHDAFLIANPVYEQAVKRYLKSVHQNQL